MHKPLLVLASLIVTTPAILAQSTHTIADFEQPVTGLKGDIVQDTTVFKEGKASGRVDADLAEVTQSAWITISKPIIFAEKIKSLHFWLKSAEATQITVRIIDSTGQKLQVRMPLQPGEAWQEVIVPSFESGPGFQAYDGAKDKKVHWPAKSIALIIEKNALPTGKGTVWIDDVKADTTNATNEP